MAFPAKNYERLKALQKKWKVSQDDMFYAIENGILRTCIWLPIRYVERIAIKGRKFIFETHEHQCGFVGVRPEDCRLICNTGCAKLRIFNSVKEEGHILRLAYEPPQPDICVRLQDLVVLESDKQSFQDKFDITEVNITELREKQAPRLIVSEDYRYIKMDDLEFHFGDIQARVVQLLHNASQSHKPWVHGKTLIFESGSNAARVRDLFKNKSKWRELILSNDRGYYRLNVPLEEYPRPDVITPQNVTQQQVARG